MNTDFNDFRNSKFSLQVCKLIPNKYISSSFFKPLYNMRKAKQNKTAIKAFSKAQSQCIKKFLKFDKASNYTNFFME